MEFIRIPGENGFGKTKGVGEKFEKFNFDYTLNLNSENISEQLREIYTFAKKVRRKSFFFGGDHSISYPLIKGIWKKNPDLKLLIFDAHPDLMEPMIEPTHEEWLRALIQDGFSCKNILIIGVRKNSKNIDNSEIDFANKKNIQIIYSDELKDKKEVFSRFISSGEIYLSIDIDVLDKKVFSSTAYPENFGLMEKDFFDLLDFVIFNNNLFYGDLVEVNLKKISKDEEKTIRKILKRVDIE